MSKVARSICGRPEERLTYTWERWRRPSGISLIELLVVMALLGLIFLLFFQVLVPGLRIWTRTRAVADLEQQAMVAEEKIVLALMATTSKSISQVKTAGLSAVGMLSHGGSSTVGGYETTTGRTRWTSSTLFALRSDKVLRQTRWQGVQPTFTGKALPTTTAYALAPSELTAVLTSASTAQGGRLASHVELFAVTAPGEVRPDGQIHPAEQESFLLTLELANTVHGVEKRLRREISVVPRIRERG